MRITYSLTSDDFPFVVQPSKHPVILQFDNGVHRRVKRPYKRRSYSDALKAKIIEEARKSDDPRNIAKKHKMPPHTLYMWLKGQ